MDFNLPAFELPFFASLLLLLVMARFFGEIMEHFKQPAMIGEIIAGILLGPSVLNIVHRTEELKVISELGIFLLIIIAGLEINMDGIIRSLKGRSIIISLFAFFIPFLSGFFIGQWFGLSEMATIFIGLCIAITALPVSIRILMDFGKLNTSLGQRIISIAIFDDILALTILGVILDLKNVEPTLTNISKTIFFTILKLGSFVLIIVTIYKLITKFSQKENFIEDKLNKVLSVLKGKESLFAIFFVFILIFASITESIGLHFIIGAFFASMLISKELVGEKHLNSIHNTTNGMAIGFLAPIFFAGIGLEFQFSSINDYSLLLIIILFSFSSKIIGGYIGSRLAKLNHKTALAIGIGLNARGIMELVIANIAYKAGVISIEIFSMLVIMGVFTTICTPFLFKKAFSLVEQ
jgi:Kef-type K+ transport system membrane component KefB